MVRQNCAVGSQRVVEPIDGCEPQLVPSKVTVSVLEPFENTT